MLGFYFQINRGDTAKNTQLISSPTKTTIDSQLESLPREVFLTFAELSDPSRYESRIARTSAMVKRLANADSSELLDFLNQSRDLRAGNWQVELQNAVIQRMAALNPMEALSEATAFGHTRKQELLPLVFYEWALSNLDQAIDNAKNLDVDEEIRLGIVSNIVLSRPDLSIDQRRAIAKRLNHEWIAIHALNDERATEPFEHHEAELRAFLDQNVGSLDDLSDSQLRLLAHIVSAWLTQEGIGALAKIEQYIPKNLFRFRASSAIVWTLAEENPEMALQLAIEVGSVGFGELAWQVVNQWAQSDSAEAIRAVSTLEGQSVRRLLVDQVMESWAKQDPYDLLDSIHTMPRESQPIGREKALIEVSRSSPQTASNLLGEISDVEARDRAAIGIVSNWALQDIAKALHWIENDRAVAHLKDDLRRWAITSLLLVDPRLAFESAMGLPIDFSGVGLEAQTLEVLATWDMDRAIRMLPEISRNDSTKEFAYGSIIGSLLVEHDDFRQALDLYILLSKEIETERFWTGLSSLVLHAPMQLYKSLDELPSNEVKKQAASRLLMSHGSNGLFSEEQLAHLQEVDGSARRQRSPVFD